MSRATKQVLLRLTPGVKQTMVLNAKKLKLTLSEYVTGLVACDVIVLPKEKP